MFNVNGNFIDDFGQNDFDKLPEIRHRANCMGALGVVGAWLAANAGTIATVATTAASVYAATQSPESQDMPDLDLHKGEAVQQKAPELASRQEEKDSRKKGRRALLYGGKSRSGKLGVGNVGRGSALGAGGVT